MTESYEFGAEIERLLAAIAERPGDLELHQNLRTMSLRYKAAGGPPLGRLAWLFRGYGLNALQHLIYVERAWSHDVGNVDRLLDVKRAVESCIAARRDLDFAAVSRWLEDL